MTVNVLIERDKAGRLHAYVLQTRGDGLVERGDDMLKKRSIRDVSAAKIECDTQLAKLFILLDLKQVNYTFPEDLKE